MMHPALTSHARSQDTLDLLFHVFASRPPIQIAKQHSTREMSSLAESLISHTSLMLGLLRSRSIKAVIATSVNGFSPRLMDSKL